MRPDNKMAAPVSQASGDSLNMLDREIYGNLSKALIEHCRQDGNEASQALSVKLSNINAQLNNLKNKIDQGTDSQSLSENVHAALSEVIEAFMQLQFFDRVSQRLDHASQSVDLTLDPSQAISDPIDKHFTMEDERVLYNALLQGATVKTAVAQASSRLDDTLNKSDGDDIELF